MVDGDPIDNGGVCSSPGDGEGTASSNSSSATSSSGAMYSSQPAAGADGGASAAGAAGYSSAGGASDGGASAAGAAGYSSAGGPSDGGSAAGTAGYSSASGASDGGGSAAGAASASSSGGVPDGGVPDGGLSSAPASSDSSDGGSTSFTPASQNLSSQAYSQSDQNACSAGGNLAIGGAVASCSQKASISCDIDDLVLSEIPGTNITAYHLEDWEFVADPPQPTSRAIALTGVSGGVKQPKLQVVGDRPGVTAATQIRAYAYPFASCGDAHVAVTASGPDGTDVEKVFGGQGTFDFPVSRYQSDNLAVALFERVITIGAPPNRYLVSASSCGVRTDGSQTYTGGSLTVEVLPCDQYQLTLHVPPFKKKTYTRDKETNKENTVTTTTEGDQNETSTTTDTMRNQTRRHTITFKQSEPDEHPEFTLKVNGQDDSASANINKLLEVLEDVKAAMAKIEAALKQVPQVSLKFEYELGFFSGDISIACGWKESKDWRCYYAFSYDIKVQLIEISLTLSWGIKLGPGLARVEGKIDQAHAELEGKQTFNDPDDKAHLSITTEIAIPFVIQGRAEADLYVKKLSCAAGIKTGFTGEGGFKLNGKWKTFAKVDWNGIDAFASYQGLTGGEEQHIVHLIDKVPICSYGSDD